MSSFFFVKNYVKTLVTLLKNIPDLTDVIFSHQNPHGVSFTYEFYDYIEDCGCCHNTKTIISFDVGPLITMHLKKLSRDMGLPEDSLQKALHKKLLEHSEIREEEKDLTLFLTWSATNPTVSYSDSEEELYVSLSWTSTDVDSGKKITWTATEVDSGEKHTWTSYDLIFDKDDLETYPYRFQRSIEVCHGIVATTPGITELCDELCEYLNGYRSPLEKTLSSVGVSFPSSPDI